MKLNQNVYRVFRFYLLAMRIIGYIVSILFIYNSTCYFIEWEIILFKGRRVVIRIIFDWIRVRFIRSVFLIAGSICKFSFYYIIGDKDYLRFIFLLISFVRSIIFLIIRPNLISILLGWDGLGLTSYALVIYYQNESSCNAGILTVLRNRIGDVCILMRIGLLLFNGRWNFIFFERNDVLLLRSFLLVIAGITKRAQIPFSAWLPAAIAAPTPVSALVHSSTLVTAGVFLLIRFYPCIKERGIIEFLLVISVITRIISGWGANFEVDIKKIIALSTLSQLGLIMMILRLGIPDLAFFHLITHAIFKSTLFICGGTIIHMSDGSQDSRSMRSLRVRSPLLRGVFRLTNLALSGFPFLAGFYSKDLLLEFFFRGVFNIILVIIMVGATGITVSYRLRAIFLGMSSVSNLKRVRELMDNNQSLKISIRLLRIFRIVLGFFFSWNFCWSSIRIVLGRFSKYYIIGVRVVRGLFITYFCINFQTFKMINRVRIKVYGYRRMWFLPFTRTKYLVKRSMRLRDFRLKGYDKGWLEEYGGKGGEKLFSEIRVILQKGQNRIMLKNYFLNILVFTALIFIIY